MALVWLITWEYLPSVGVFTLSAMGTRSRGSWVGDMDNLPKVLSTSSDMDTHMGLGISLDCPGQTSKHSKSWRHLEFYGMHQLIWPNFKCYPWPRVQVIIRQQVNLNGPIHCIQNMFNPVFSFSLVQKLYGNINQLFTRFFFKWYC